MNFNFGFDFGGDDLLPIVENNIILLETGDFLMLEDGTSALLTE